MASYHDIVLEGDSVSGKPTWLDVPPPDDIEQAPASLGPAWFHEILAHCGFPHSGIWNTFEGELGTFRGVVIRSRTP